MKQTGAITLGQATNAKAIQPWSPQAFDGLQEHRFLNVTTFRKTGARVTTPVWFGLEAGKLYVVTQRDSGKVKRIRYRPTILVALATATGAPVGPQLDARARIMESSEDDLPLRVLRGKYGWQLRIFEWLWRLQRKAHVFLEIVPA